jgi:ElaB/YqjD/DUF883 family membrane-anchored ribosome-binding protein
MRSTSQTSTGNATNALGRDMQNVVSDAQELLKTVQSEGESKLADVKARVATQLDTAKQKFGEIQQTVQDGAKVAMTETDAYVRGNPWTSIGIGVAIGAVIGYLASSAARRD